MITYNLETEKIAVPVPLRKGEGDIIYVGQTRIPLERVIYYYNQGQSPEAIVHSFDTLKLADVYTVISFYLHHQEEVDRYVQRREAEEDEAQRDAEARFPREGRRERLLARQKQRK